MQIASSHSTSKLSQLFWRYILPVCALAVTGWMALAMLQRTEQELLWGWRPFFLLISGWIGVLSLVKGFGKADTQRDRWLLLTSLSGVLLSLGFPPSPLTPLMFVGLVPLLMVGQELRDQHGKAMRWKVYKYAFNTFFIWNICTTWWILNTSFLPGIVANTLNTIFMATVFMAFHHACSVLPPRVHGIVLAAFWMAFEYLHLNWEISWPWLTFGNALAQYPAAIQWYEFTGVFGGSLWLLIGNHQIFRWYTSGRPLKLLIWIVLWICIPLAWSIYRYVTIELPEGDVEVVVVQPNFEPHYQKFVVPATEQLERFLSLSRGSLTDSTDYLVFPETSLGFINLQDVESNYQIKALRGLFEEYPDLHIVTGLESYRVHLEPSDLKTIRAVRDRMGDTVLIDIQNSAIQIAKDAPVDVYFKSKLVPGAEFLPFRDFLPFMKPLVDMLQGSVAGLTGQKTRDVFHSDIADVAPVICYESVYGEYVGGYVRNGADIIFIVTNDGWWDLSPGHIQHLKIGAMRAIEHRRPIARSANTGTSCFINIRGDVLQPTKYEETIAIRANVAPGQGMTFYTRWGDMIARIAVFLTVLIIARVITLSVVRRRA